MSKTYTYEHRGYLLRQTSYNWHYTIVDTARNKMVMHCQCGQKLTEDEAKEAIDFYIDFVRGDGPDEGC